MPWTRLPLRAWQGQSDSKTTVAEATSSSNKLSVSLPFHHYPIGKSAYLFLIYALFSAVENMLFVLLLPAWCSCHVHRNECIGVITLIKELVEYTLCTSYKTSRDHVCHAVQLPSVYAIHVGCQREKEPGKLGKHQESNHHVIQSPRGLVHLVNPIFHLDDLVIFQARKAEEEKAGMMMQWWRPPLLLLGLEVEWNYRCGHLMMTSGVRDLL